MPSASYADYTSHQYIFVSVDVVLEYFSSLFWLVPAMKIEWKAQMWMDGE